MDTTAPTIVREEPTPCRVKLNIEVPPQKVEEVFTAVEKQFHTAARIPGFRPGKAPRTLLLRHYGERINEDVKDRLFRWALQEALKAEDLQPETMPRVENEENVRVQRDDAFVFAVSFDVAPSFELPEYKKIAVRQEAVAVAEEQVEQFIEGMLRNRTSYEKVERPAEPEDLLKVSYHGKLDGKSTELPESARYLLDADDTWIALRQPEIFPGVAEKLKGAEAGETRQIAVEFPEDYYEKALAGESIGYTVQIHEVHAALVPEFTDEVARQMGVESADHARQQIKENLEARQQQEQQEAVRNQVLAALMEKVDFPLPPARLAQETYQVLMRLYEQESRQGKDEEALREDAEKLHQRAEELARQQLKRHYLLSRIADEEDLRVSQQELGAMIQYLSRMNRISPKAMHKRLEENHQLGNLVEHILENKTISRLTELADVQEAETNVAAESKEARSGNE